MLREGVMEQTYPNTSGNLAMQQDFEDEPRTAPRPAPVRLYVTGTSWTITDG